MKKFLSVCVALLLSIIPAAFAVDTGGSIGIDIGVEDFAPKVWLCGSGVILDDAIEPGRLSQYGDKLVERINNYAFEGESIVWNVVVFDKNGIEKIKDVYVTLGPTSGTGNDIEANCQLQEIRDSGDGIANCNARIGEEWLSHFDDNNMASYRCQLTVESPESMQGEYFITVEAEDLTDQLGAFDENEFWFLNPEIALSVEGGELDFGSDVRPGTASYSNTITVGNDAQDGSGVLLDMYIAGTDFYDSGSSGAKCPVSNVLDLNPRDKGLTGPLYTVDNMPTGIQYYARNGVYTSNEWTSDPEGYLTIPYGNRIDQSKEIMGTQTYTNSHTYGTIPGILDLPNLLAPGAEISMTFRLVLPEPCNGNFDTGQIFFWGEAI